MTSTPRLTVGIDPGLMGALAWLDDAVELARLLVRHGQPHRAIIEMVGARPTDSRTGAFTFGRNLGAIEALVMAAHIPMMRVSPITWRRAAGLVAGVGKEASLAAALRLHPSARLHLEGKLARHDRGDAILIASWGERHG